MGLNITFGKGNPTERIKKKQEALEKLKTENKLIEEERKIDEELKKERDKRYKLGEVKL